MKNSILGGLSILVALCVVFITGEVAIRLVHAFKNSISDSMPRRLIEVDADQGWRPVADYFYQGELVDAAGAAYPVTITTNSEGYRSYGDTFVEGKKKVLFLGDSYTHAMQVSNDNTYHHILASELGLESFSIGVNGYGTLQQLLLLDKVLEDIRPDMVVLQFCPNDFINNHYVLEQTSAFNNNGLRRPYFNAGKVQYKTPTDYAAIRAFAANYSEFLYFIIKNLDKLKAPPESASEHLIESHGEALPAFQESVQITDQLLQKIRQRIPPDTPIYTFSTDHGFPYRDVFMRLSKKNGMHFIDGTSQALRLAESKGVNTRAADTAHWNNRGHKIVADVLRNFFSREQPLKE